MKRPANFKKYTDVRFANLRAAIESRQEAIDMGRPVGDSRQLYKELARISAKSARYYASIGEIKKAQSSFYTAAQAYEEAGYYQRAAEMFEKAGKQDDAKKVRTKFKSRLEEVTSNAAVIVIVFIGLFVLLFLLANLTKLTGFSVYDVSRSVSFSVDAFLILLAFVVTILLTKSWIKNQ